MRPIWLAGAAAIGLAVCAQMTSQTLAQEDEAPLPEDNSFCLVCHVNFEEEELVAQHLPGGVTCCHCHGASYDHRDDESHRTPPDILFGRAEIDPFCETCHAEHEATEKVEAFMEEHSQQLRPNGRVLRTNAVCTDCHGVHIVSPGT